MTNSNIEIESFKNAKNKTAVKLTAVSCAPVVEVKIKRPDTKYQLGFSVQNGVVSRKIGPKNTKWILIQIFLACSLDLQPPQGRYSRTWRSSRRTSHYWNQWSERCSCATWKDREPSCNICRRSKLSNGMTDLRLSFYRNVVKLDSIPDHNEDHANIHV